MHKGGGFYTSYAENAKYNEELHNYLAFHGTSQGDGQRAAVANSQTPAPISATMVTMAHFRQTQSYECHKQRFCTLDREGEPARWYASLQFQANGFNSVDAETRGTVAAELALTMKRPSEGDIALQEPTEAGMGGEDGEYQVN
jgi:hypothetical protein